MYPIKNYQSKDKISKYDHNTMTYVYVYVCGQYVFNMFIVFIQTINMIS
jgi:hypothetical protein